MKKPRIPADDSQYGPSTRAVHAGLQDGERRGRWGTDDVPNGFIRYSAGCDDPEDLVSDLIAALDRTR